MEKQTGVNSATEQPERVTVAQVQTRLDRGEPILFLDTRAPDAWNNSNEMIRGAMRMPVNEIEQRLRDLPRDRPIVTYCT